MPAAETILITGGCGFVGSRLVAEFARRNFRVFILDDFSASSPTSIDFSAGDITLFGGCVTDRKFVKHILSLGVTRVAHLATRNITVSQIDPENAFRVNAGGTLSLIKDAEIAGVKRIVFTSTTSVYDDRTLPMVESGPLRARTIYSVSKQAAEQFVSLSEKAPVTILRLSNVYGPGQSDAFNPYCGVIGHFMRSAMTDKPLQIFGDGSDTRDYTYIDDVINAISLAVFDSKSDGSPRNQSGHIIYNIGTGIEVSVAELAKTVQTISGKTLGVEHCQQRSIDVIRRRVVDASIFRNDFGWEPLVTIEQGLQKTWEHWNASHRN